ncbi:Uncharacterized protein QTN25_006724 [Entamoeba marina]
MHLPSFDSHFFLAGLGCFICTLYVYGMLCDKKPVIARGFAIIIWVLTFLQSLLMFFTYPWYLPLLSTIHHLFTFLLVLKIPHIYVFSVPFYALCASTFMAQFTILYVFFMHGYQLHELILTCVTFQSVSVIILSSLQIEGQRVGSEFGQSINLMMSISQKVLNFFKIKGGALHKQI